MNKKDFYLYTQVKTCFGLYQVFQRKYFFDLIKFTFVECLFNKQSKLFSKFFSLARLFLYSSWIFSKKLCDPMFKFIVSNFVGLKLIVEKSNTMLLYCELQKQLPPIPPHLSALLNLPSVKHNLY